MNLQLQTMIDTYNQTADHPLSYAVGYELSCKNHYYLIMDLLQMADEKMYQDKRYKKQLQKNGPLAARRSMLAESISTDSLKEKIFTLLNNRSEEKQYAFLMTDVDNFHLINDYWGYEMGTNILNFILKKLELFPQTLFVNRYHSDIFVGIIDITGQDPAVVREKISAYHKQAIREVLESYPLNYMTLNTGVYYLNDTDTPAEEVISHANIARRRAKETSTCVFEYNARGDHSFLPECPCEKRISDLFPAENQRKNAGNCKRRGAGTLAARGRHALVPGQLSADSGGDRRD